ncbi:MAG: TrmB family transcriptional regulator [Halobellus sp.]|uniref:TrmB family transcriptional regulator n=1 Tax=Halobellus sp. TaxID=1979212 RepID=UPI0035D4C278
MNFDADSDPRDVPETTVSEHEAVAALEHLGLSNYAARVFVALQRLGVGTAKQIHKETDVPRSQVYGAAEELLDVGMVELQQSTPKRYRPVSLDTARRQLAERMQQEADRAFEFLEAQREARIESETRDDVWTIHGREPIHNRVAELARQGVDSVLFAAPKPEFVPSNLLETLRARAEAGASVRVLSEDAAVREMFADIDGVAVAEAVDPPMDHPGRVLIVDDRVVLLSATSPGDAADETAIWAADTAMAEILARVIEDSIQRFVSGSFDDE